jgi:hypothetical protein
MTPKDLLNEVQRARSAGITRTLWLPVVGDVPAAVDDVAIRAGLRPLGDGWQELPPAAARDLLKDVLHRDLAYGMEAMSADQAAQLASAVLGLMPESARWFSNRIPGDNSWNPATDATFDAGVVGISTEGAVVIWVEDED